MVKQVAGPDIFDDTVASVADLACVEYNNKAYVPGPLTRTKWGMLKQTRCNLLRNRSLNHPLHILPAF